MVAAAVPTVAGSMPRSASDRVAISLFRAGHDPLERRVARLAERLRAADDRRHRRLEHVVAGRADAPDADTCGAMSGSIVAA